jgi:hypothetical protein
VTKRIPDEAFTFYMGLGPDRSYQKVAERFGVSKRAVSKRAQADDWASRAEKIQAESRARQDAGIVDAFDEMNQRHLKVLKVIQGKALEALRTLPLERATDAVKALELVMKQERIARGDPDEGNETVEQLIKREYERWLVASDGTESDR